VDRAPYNLANNTNGAIVALYHFQIISITIPWLPVSVIGTAVAFYVGFKNNQAYDRMWEARKIWGGIVNDSRAWGMILVATPWEHISQGGHIARTAKMYQEKFGIGLLDDEITRTELKLFLPESEHDRLVANVNTATQIINEQSRDLTILREQDFIDDFRHTQMEDVLRMFYTLQGKNERIKKFPLPRQYANMSRYFVAIFILMLPFSMIPELMELGKSGLWLSIPITALIGWVYVMMEIVGDYSENPFQGMANDIPMMALCRVIEIDLREMLGEKDLPPKVEAKNGVLM